MTEIGAASTKSCLPRLPRTGKCHKMSFSRMVQIGFESRHVDHNHWVLINRQ